MSLASFPRETPDIETSSDEYASRFAGAAGEYFLQVQSQSVRRALADRPDSTVLEVGGGHGQLVPVLLELGSKITILGSDDATHDRVKHIYRGTRVRCVTGDILALPFDDQSFHIVVAVRLMSHVDQWRKLLSEFCRVARHSIVIDYPRWISLNGLAPLLFSLKKRLEGDTRRYRSFCERDLSRTFEKHGFNVAWSYNQFLAPMCVHRWLQGAQWVQRAELTFRRMRLTGVLGSPAVLRADRVRLSEDDPGRRT